jgi:hypothetical protein
MGVEPIGDAPATTERPKDVFPTYPVGGLCSLLILVDYRLHLIEQFCLPVYLLHASVKLTIIPGEFICAFLSLSYIDCRDVLHFRSRKPILSKRGRRRQLNINLTLNYKNISLSQDIRNGFAF